MGKSPEEKVADSVNLVEAMKGTVRQLHKAIQELQKDGPNASILRAACVKSRFPRLDLDKFMKAKTDPERLDILLASVAAQQNRGN